MRKLGFGEVSHMLKVTECYPDPAPESVLLATLALLAGT